MNRPDIATRERSKRLSQFSPTCKVAEVREKKFEPMLFSRIGNNTDYRPFRSRP